MSDHVSPHLASSALVIVDVQRDFIDGAMPIPGTAAVLPTLMRLASGFRSLGRPLMHVIRLYEPGSADVDALRRADVEGGTQLVSPGTPGAEIPAALLPDATPVALEPAQLLRGETQQLAADEAILYKPRWSAFHRTTLDAWLDERAVDTVVVAGCNLPNCPRATLFDASQRDLRTVLATDAVSGATPERLADLELIGVNLLSTTEILAGLAEAA